MSRLTPEQYADRFLLVVCAAIVLVLSAAAVLGIALVTGAGA